MNPLLTLSSLGQSVWYDNIQRSMLTSGMLQRLVEDDGLKGVTSNPSIFEKAINGSSDYDGALAALHTAEPNATSRELFFSLAIEDVQAAADILRPVYDASNDKDGMISLEVGPDLAHDADGTIAEARELWQRVDRPNLMIKVPATPAGLDSLEELTAAGVTLNVTLIFAPRQYEAARDAVWRGARRRRDMDGFKSVYSIFVSRTDVYTEKHVADLSPQAQGQVGIVVAKRIWAANRQFWADKQLPLAQEMIFASTGTKKPDDPPWKYVEAFAGSDIETNPPATNDAVEASGRTISRQVDQLPSTEVLAEIDAKIDMAHLEATLMDEGIQKFANPQKALLALIAEKQEESQRV